MAELTRLGRFLRKLRIDRSELLRDMAAKLDVAISFLSSVENGNKSMPSEWVAKISEGYCLSDEQKRELDSAVADSEKGIGVRFEGLSPESRQLSVAFARKVKSFTRAERDRLKEILF